MNIYFLTGASGAVGSAVVPLLIADTNTRVRILLRAKSDEHLQQRFEELCRFWELPPDSIARHRIEPLRGDAAEPQFALTDREYATLCTDTTHIIHCAATVRMNETLEDARASAVGSAQQILTLARQLASAGVLQKVDSVSTVGIAGKRPGALPERWIDEPREFHNTYEQSKAEAEELLRHAVEVEQLPITVHRPSMVIGDSKTGRIIHFQIFYFICEFLSGRKTFGLFPKLGNVQLDVIPVDWVADAIVKASRDPATIKKIFHLASGPSRAPSLHDLRRLVRSTFRRAGIDTPPGLSLPRSWFAILPKLVSMFATTEQRRALSTIPIYLAYLADQQAFDNTDYLAWAEGESPLSKQPSSYLPTVIEHYLKVKYRS